MSAALARLASRNSKTQKGDPGFRWIGKPEIQLANQELRKSEPGAEDAVAQLKVGLILLEQRTGT